MSITNEDQAKIERECDIFANPPIGAMANNDYEVTGVYMDANGCLKTHGKHHCSFITDTDYQHN